MEPLFAIGLCVALGLGFLDQFGPWPAKLRQEEHVSVVVASE